MLNKPKSVVGLKPKEQIRLCDKRIVNYPGNQPAKPESHLPSPLTMDYNMIRSGADETWA